MLTIDFLRIVGSEFFRKSFFGSESGAATIAPPKIYQYRSLVWIEEKAFIKKENLPNNSYNKFLGQLELEEVYSIPWHRWRALSNSLASLNTVI